MAPARKSSLLQLRDLTPLQPWKTPAPAFSEIQKVLYIKLKEPLVVRNGTRVFWQTKKVRKEAGDDELGIEIPYEGVFEFFDKRVIKTIRRWINRLL